MALNIKTVEAIRILMSRSRSRLFEAVARGENVSPDPCSRCGKKGKGHAIDIFEELEDKMAKSKKKRWVAKGDSAVKLADGQVRLVKAGEIVLADKAPSIHFEPANPADKSSSVVTIQGG